MLEVKVLLPLLLTTLTTLKVLQDINYRWWCVDSLYLAQCIYSGGCNAETIPSIPSYIQPDRTLKITDEHASISTICSLVSNNFWKYIEVGDNMCNDQTELSIDNANLISLSVGKSFTSVTSISLSRIFTFPLVYCIMSRG